MPRKSMRSKLREFTLSYKYMTKKDLKAYIKIATDEINKHLKKSGATGYSGLNTELDYLREKYGSKRTKKTRNALQYGYGKENKESLYTHALNLRNYFAYDIESKGYVVELSAKEKKAYESFLQNTGIEVDKKTYKQLVSIFTSLGSEITEVISSDQLANLFNEYKGSGNKYDFVDIVKEIVKDNEGITQTDLLELIKDRIQELFGE